MEAVPLAALTVERGVLLAVLVFLFVALVWLADRALSHDQGAFATALLPLLTVVMVVLVLYAAAVFEVQITMKDIKDLLGVDHAD